MSLEADLVAALAARFPNLPAATIQRDRRMSVEVPVGDLLTVMGWLREAQGYAFISTIAGTDEGDDLAFRYFMNDFGKSLITLVVKVPKTDPRIPTITGIFPGAVFYERELVDLLGTVVEGLPPGDRYPLRDDWPTGMYPLRKDWRPEMLNGIYEEARNG